jgi:acyl dehydratase
MQELPAESLRLSTYRVRATNTATDSENRIHSDEVAARFGFRGGLVPGVTVYAYMTVPIVAEFGLRWIERGSIQVKFHQPFYEGEEVTVRSEVDRDSEPVRVMLTAERAGGVVCATGLATVDDDSSWLGETRAEDYAEAPLPEFDARPAALRKTLMVGNVLGTISEKLDLSDTSLLERVGEQLPIYYGADRVAHPMLLLGLANQALMRNFKLGPWIHTASDLINRSAARCGETVSVRGRIRDCYERKGHEFVVLDLLLLADSNRIVQQVRHTAIYRPRIK